VTIDRAAPWGLGPLNQQGSKHYGEKACHSQPATDTTHPAPKLPDTAPTSSESAGPGGWHHCAGSNVSLVLPRWRARSEAGALTLGLQPEFDARASFDPLVAVPGDATARRRLHELSDRLAGLAVRAG